MTAAPDAEASLQHARVRPPGRLLVPDVRIRVSAAANTKQLEKRFNYLWQGAHGILPTNALLAHQMMYDPRNIHHKGPAPVLCSVWR